MFNKIFILFIALVTLSIHPAGADGNEGDNSPRCCVSDGGTQLDPKPKDPTSPKP